MRRLVAYLTVLLTNTLTLLAAAVGQWHLRPECFRQECEALGTSWALVLTAVALMLAGIEDALDRRR